MRSLQGRINESYWRNGMKLLGLFFLCMFLSLPALAQEGMGGIPAQVSIVVGGGPSAPLGSLSDKDDAGWNARAAVCVRDWIPVHLLAFAQYNRLPNRHTLAGAGAPVQPSDESDVAWLFGVGAQFPFSLPIVSPHIDVEGFVSSLSNTAANAPTMSREGIDFGAGAEIPFPIIGEAGVSVKYQILNLGGKDTNEDTFTQIIANISLSFDLL